MIIALDATPLAVPTGGVRRYAAELARALAVSHPPDRVWLVTDQPFEMPDQLPNLLMGQSPKSAADRKWWLWGVSRELGRIRADIFHGVDFSVPYLPLRPSVMTIHDTSPWRDPSWHGRAGRVRRRTPLLLRARLATMVVTPSEAVRREVIARFRIPPEQIAAIPLAPPEWLTPQPRDPQTPPYFLWLGTLEPRKNLETIVAAWRELRISGLGPELWLAGRLRADYAGIASEPGLRLLGPVDDHRLAALYSNAAAVLYPSLYEGFGLPVLEAMRCGALVLASRDPALMDTSGGCAIHLDALDVRSWRDAMLAAVDAPQNEIRERAILHARSFSWHNTAARTREVYEEAQRRFRR